MSRTRTILRWSAGLALGFAAAVAPRPAEAQETRTKAPQLRGGEWINTSRPITLGDLKGKVVLLDFWTFG
jgi:hypothetical protein